MSVTFDQAGVEPPLKQMTIKPVAAVEALRVGGVEAPHSSRQLSHRRFDDQVVMSFEQAVTMKMPRQLARYAIKERQKEPPITIVRENRLSSVTTGGDVKRPVGKVASGSSGHPREGRRHRMSSHQQTLTPHALVVN
jgi:hypothetical protein